MSYCRWSSDNWRSDVYAWEDESDGFRVAVASVRYVGAIPPLDMSTLERLRETLAAQEKVLDEAPKENIGGPCDGGYYELATRAELLAKLLELREAGYHVPEAAIKQVREELEEEAL